MAQTVYSITLVDGQKKILLEKPTTLKRIFGNITVRGFEGGCASKVSFGDPLFYSFFVLNKPVTTFEMKGEGIFQGDVWVQNISGISLLYSMSEILV